MEPAEKVGPISWRGKCERCALEIVTNNVLSMIEHEGPQWQLWRRGMAACVGGVLAEDRESG